VDKPQTYDVLVIGSGIAGLSFALELADSFSVAVVTKKGQADSATSYAQGGIAAAIGPEDSIELHYEDTTSAGAGLCNPEVVKIVAEEGPAKIEQLMDWGTSFTRGDKGELELGREGGHRVSRIVHYADFTGREVERALLERVRQHKNINLMENKLAVDVITDRHLSASSRKPSKRCYGAYVFNPETKKVDMIRSRAVLLASGGMGCVWKYTTNPSIATGDGVAISWRAGARIANLEFMQFHPTALYKAGNKSQFFLISEAVRGFGAILYNHREERFMKGVHELEELAPRDVVARAIDNELVKWGMGHVWLDVTNLPADKVRDRFPMIYSTLLEQYNIDITKDPIPVSPAAHYQCGGVITDLNAQTTIERLYAAGEVAQTGLHGANRLASNSLLEAVVFASRAASAVKKTLLENKGECLPDIPHWDDSGTYDPEEWILISYDRQEIRQLMRSYVGILRSDHRLKRAELRLELLTREIEDYWQRTVVSPELVELRNMAQVAKLVVHCAMMRKESRGLHYTTDYPDRDDIFGARDTII